MSGFFLIDKPTGMTSHDVVRYVKRQFNFKKVGHTGTLDPFASGLLIVCVERATKIADLLSAKNKAYTGTIVLGKHFDTYDTTGQVLDEKDFAFSKAQLEQKMKHFVGSYYQLPPMHSAIKINGQKLYHLAHQGKTIDRPKRLVHIHAFDLLSFDNHQINFYAHVSKGTYMRSLAVDLAEQLDTLGALSVLRRTSIGNYQLADAKPLKALQLTDMIPLTDYFKNFPKVTLDNYMIKLVKNGVVLDERQTTLEEPFVICDETGTFIACYKPIAKHQYKPLIIF